MAISTKFDGIVVFLIVSNVVVMSIQHYGQSATYDFALTTANYVFTCIFALDVTTKLLGLRQHYFYDPWNVFDFIIIILSLLGNTVIYQNIMTDSKSDGSTDQLINCLTKDQLS